MLWKSAPAWPTLPFRAARISLRAAGWSFPRLLRGTPGLPFGTLLQPSDSDLSTLLPLALPLLLTLGPEAGWGMLPRTPGTLGWAPVPLPHSRPAFRLAGRGLRPRWTGLLLGLVPAAALLGVRPHGGVFLPLAPRLLPTAYQGKDVSGLWFPCFRQRRVKELKFQVWGSPAPTNGA